MQKWTLAGDMVTFWPVIELRYFMIEIKQVSLFFLSIIYYVYAADWTVPNNIYLSISGVKMNRFESVIGL